MKPAVSVVMPTFNVERYVAKAIQSVLNQTIRELELIVVDDGSSDRTTNVVREFRDDRLIVLHNSANCGPSYSRNRAIEHASGEWIAVLDSDDWWDPRRLEHLLGVAERTGADLAADDLLLIRDGEAKPHATYMESRRSIVGSAQGLRDVSALAMAQDDYGYLKPLFKAELIKQHRIRYDDMLFSGEDFKFTLECLLAGGRMVISPEALYYYRIRRHSLSSQDRAVSSLQAQLLSLAQLIAATTDVRDVNKALRQLKRKKSIHLKELRIAQHMRKKHYLKAAGDLLAQPAVLRPLLRNWLKQGIGLR